MAKASNAMAASAEIASQANHIEQEPQKALPPIQDDPTKWKENLDWESGLKLNKLSKISRNKAEQLISRANFQSRCVGAALAEAVAFAISEIGESSHHPCHAQQVVRNMTIAPPLRVSLRRRPVWQITSNPSSNRCRIILKISQSYTPWAARAARAAPLQGAASWQGNFVAMRE